MQGISALLRWKLGCKAKQEPQFRFYTLYVSLAGLGCAIPDPVNGSQIRDPFILPLPEERRYLLFGSTDKDIWSGPGTGFDCYESRDLEAWTGPIPAFRPPTDFWSNTQSIF